MLKNFGLRAVNNLMIKSFEITRKKILKCHFAVRQRGCGFEAIGLSAFRKRLFVTTCVGRR